MLGALAVSGGSDSLALLYLAHEWAKVTGRALVVLTVDHRLRPEAKQEAEMVATLCAKLGHTHRTLTWATPRASQAAARRARYVLLAQAARAQNARILMTGHTFDDVVETAMIRRRRGVRQCAQRRGSGCCLDDCKRQCLQLVRASQTYKGRRVARHPLP